MIKNLSDHKKEEERGKQKLLQMSEISLWLYHYDDIFSDFDPRPYSQRALSEDFLNESKRMSREKLSGKLQLTFSVPGRSRDGEKEKIIKRRLRDHFKKHSLIVREEFKGKVAFGWRFVLSGIVIMFAAAYVYFKFQQTTLLTSFLIILLEPAGWFLFWEGLDVLIFESKKIKPEVEFYEKMAMSEIDFISY